MKSRVTIILVTYFLTVLACMGYTVYMAFTIAESASIAIPFAFVFVTAIALFAETILFGLLFIKHFREVFSILVPVFLITCPVPLYFLNNWYQNLPVKVPIAGHLPVSIETYKADSKSVTDDYLKTELDSNNVDIYRDTIQEAFIDTIFYSLDKTKFFAIIVAVASDHGKVKYCAKYRVGRLVSGKWELGNPKGNIWSTCFQSVDSFKNELRQYYYKSYSINKSSDKPEIWNDSYIFNF